MDKTTTVFVIVLICTLINSITMDQAAFPSNFKFGVATSSYQIEGSWNVDGKSLNIWDYYTHTFPDLILDKSNGDIACDSYNKIDEDVQNLKKLKVNFYRLSLSWCRILPTGYTNIINQAGVAYYNKLINKLLENGIEPVVTIYHWDLPKNFQDLGGWTNVKMADYFAEFARVCFDLFGDRVKTWITINEPYEIVLLGYGIGSLAPFYHLDGIAPYLAGHTILLAHAKAYHIYKQYFKQTQKGRVGITIESAWFEPKTNSTEDIEQAETEILMYSGWFIHPIYSQTGDYPEIMREKVDQMSKKQGFPESRLPRFTKEEIKMIRGTSDFLGLNHYTTFLVQKNNSVTINPHPSYNDDVGSVVSMEESWEDTARDYFKVVPWGFRKLLNWVKNRYGNPEVFITENGYAGFQNETTEDIGRINYNNLYLKAVLEAITEDNCNVVGYTAWSLMDNYEWADGYTMKFGMFHVDFENSDRPRTPKKSAFVYQNIIVTRKIDENLIPNDFLH